MSRKLCGAVIGQKGQTIRDFMSDSGAAIRVQVRMGAWAHDRMGAWAHGRAPCWARMRAWGGARARERDAGHAHARTMRSCPQATCPHPSPSHPPPARPAPVATQQPLSELTPSDSERIINVSGSRDRVLRATALILNTVRAGASWQWGPGLSGAGASDAWLGVGGGWRVGG